MKKTVIHMLYALVLSTGVASAQEFDFSGKPTSSPVDPKEYESINDAFFGASVGVSYPLGQFKSKDYQNYYSGYAEKGFYLNLINAHQKFGKHFGIGANWFRGQYGFASNEFIEIYEELVPELAFTSKVDDDWTMNSLLGSLVINVPHKLFDVDVRIGIGACRVVRPEIYVEGIEKATGFIAWTWQQERVAKAEVQYGFGMNGRLHLNQTIDLLVQWDYQRMKTTLEVVNIYAQTFVVEEKLDQHFETFNFGFGVGVQID